MTVFRLLPQRHDITCNSSYDKTPGVNYVVQRCVSLIDIYPKSPPSLTHWLTISGMERKGG